MSWLVTSDPGLWFVGKHNHPPQSHHMLDVSFFIPNQSSNTEHAGHLPSTYASGESMATQCVLHWTSNLTIKIDREFYLIN